MDDWAEKQDVMQRYDATARVYDRLYGEEQTAKIHAALEILNIERESLVLDVGCGTGLLFSHVKNKTVTVVGLDISRNIILQANEHTKRSQTVHLILADADNMPFQEAIFNHLFAVTLIQNMPNPSRTLNEMKRVTKNGAIIVVTGLKKSFSRMIFKNLLQKVGLDVIHLTSKGLKCHLAVCKFSSLISQS